MNPAVPSPDHLNLQARWLSTARARLLRRANIANRKLIVDLAAGSCAVSAELARRSGGNVIAVDASAQALQRADENVVAASIQRVCADALALPLADSSVDLVFVQCGFLWFAEPERAIAEIVRILRPGGALAAIEPDYGGLIEHPPEVAVKDVWIAALSRSGADPFIGRKLPELLARAGISVEVQLLDQLASPQPERFDFLAELPLTAEEAGRVQSARQYTQPMPRTVVAHLPFFLVLCEKPQ